MAVNIYKYLDNYKITKTIYSRVIDYGNFNTYNEALNQKKLLQKHKWIKSKSTHYDKENIFPKYLLKKDEENNYIIINKNTGKTYGSYKSKRYAKIIKRILPFYKENINIKKIEKQALKEFYKYIHYNKFKNKFHIIYKDTTIGTYNTLLEALTERDLLIKFENELYFENPNTCYTYDKKRLPPFYTSNDITFNSNENKYKLTKKIHNKEIIIGFYSTYTLANNINKYLEKNYLELNVIKHIIKVTKQIQTRDNYIDKSHGIYYIKHRTNEKEIIYAKYDDIELARYIRNKLKKDNWKKSSFEDYEYNYYQNQIKTKYYYDNTDIFKKA